VSEGREVKRGQIMAALGASGKTEWPRLAFGVTRNGMVFDPFSGRTPIEGCEAEAKPLWLGGFNPPYEPAHVTTIGFSRGFPTNEQIIRGMNSLNNESTEVPRLSLWAMLMNITENDRIEMRIETPDNRILKDETIVMEQDERYLPIYFTVSRNHDIWEPGFYRGTITITRDVNGNDIIVGKTIPIQLFRIE
jgi:hypothetical protein